MKRRIGGTMKKIFWGTAILFPFFLSSTAFADYVIKLKNGRSFQTATYWEEGGVIKFHWLGGMAGIAREEILSVEKKEKSIAEEIVYVSKPSAESSGASSESKGVPVKEGEKSKGEVEMPRVVSGSSGPMGDAPLNVKEPPKESDGAFSSKKEVSATKGPPGASRLGDQIFTIEDKVKNKPKGIVQK